MYIDKGNSLLTGEKVSLRVVKHQGKPVFETEFIRWDMVAQKYEHGEEQHCFEANCSITHKSVRIYQLAADEKLKLEVGDMVKAEVKSFSVAWNMTADGRRKIYISVKNARRVFSGTRAIEWPAVLVRNTETPKLRITLKCGSKILREKKIPLTLKHVHVLHDGRVWSTRQLFLPNRSVVQVLADSMAFNSVGQYREEQRKTLGKLATNSMLDAMIKSLPVIENFDNATDRTKPTNRERLASR